MSFRRLTTMTVVLAVFAAFTPLAVRPAAADPSAKATPAASPTGCSVSGQGVYTSDSCSIGTARDDYAGITFTHVDNGTYAYCTYANETDGCIQEVRITPSGDSGDTDGVSCDFFPAPEGTSHSRYDLHYPQTGTNQDTYAVQAENGFTCQSTDLREPAVFITVSGCGYSGATCPPGLSRDPGLQTLIEIDYAPGTAPAATFAATTATSTSGPTATIPANTVNFDASGSTDGQGTISSYAWDFGDGSTSTVGPTVSHTYAVGGTYPTTLTITDSNGHTASVTKSVVVNADLTSAITVTDPQGNPFTGTATAVGNSLLATVTLSAAASAAGPITGVVPSPVLTASPSMKVTQSSMPAIPDGGYTLAPGNSVTYQVSFAINATGSVTFSMSASGMEGASPESTTVQKVVHLGQPLQVDVAWQKTDGTPLVLTATGQPDQPDTLRLADNDAGEIPADVIAVVTLTNISAETQTSVTVNGIPALNYHTASQAMQMLPIGVTTGPLPTGTPTDIVPGDVRQVTYRLHVTNNGVFDFSPQVLSSDADDLNSVSQGVGTVTVLPTALLWLSVKQRDTRSIRAGDIRYLTGMVTNRSLTQSVDVVPIEPAEVDGNGGGGGLTDDSKPPLADGTVPPFSGVLKPGQTVDLSGELDTAPIPATRAVLTYQPAGAVINDDSTETDLTATQVGMSSGSSPINVAIQDTDPDLPPITVDDAFNSFTDGAVQGAGTWALGHYQAAANLWHHPVDGAAGAVAGVAKVIVHTPQDLLSAAYILDAVGVYAQAYVDLTPAQRTTYENQILADYDQSYAKADNAEASKAIAAGFESFEQAEQTGDFRTLADLTGKGLSTGGGVVADAVLSDVFFQQLGIGLKGLAKSAARGRLANAMVLADEALQRKLPAAAFREITAVKAGQNLLLKGGEALENVFGMTPDQIAGLRKFCQENKIIVAIRARSKRAADLIRRGLAVGKNEILKLKGVNEIDVDYLGYAKSDLNTLVFAEPVPRSEVIAELDRRGVKGGQREIVLERYQQRLKEWTDPKVAGVMDAADAKGEIEWGFNGTDNAAKGADRSAQRRFTLHDKRGAKMLDGKTPRTYQTVYVNNVEGAGGRLVRVTQDTDMAALLTENGQILPAALRVKAYEYLSDILGIEHPETASWIAGGDILFLSKIKELLRTAKGGGEALGVFGPDGSARAGFLNPSLTVYDSAEKTGVLFFEGGYNNPYAKAATSLVVALKRFAG